MSDETLEKKAPGARVKQPVVPDVHLIIFKLDQEYYGIHIEQVKEVTYTPVISKMPKAPGFIKGVANIRGDIMAIMDLEERMGIEKKLTLRSSKQLGKYTLVIESDEQMVGFIVEEVPFSMNIPENRIDKAKDLIEQSKVSEGFIEGIAKTPDKLIVLINIQQIINF